MSYCLISGFLSGRRIKGYILYLVDYPSEYVYCVNVCIFSDSKEWKKIDNVISKDIIYKADKKLKQK